MKIETININKEGNILGLLTDESVYIIKQSIWSSEKAVMEPIRKCSIEDITNSDNLVIRISK